MNTTPQLKAEPGKWLCFTMFFAFIATAPYDAYSWEWVVHMLALFFLAGSGGQLAVENAKYRLLKGKADEI